MVIAEPDVVAIKERIKRILTTDPELFDKSDTKGKMRSIEIGLPSNNEFFGLRYPCCFITNAEDFEIDKIYGPQVGASYGASEHLLNFKIIFFGQSKDGKSLEPILDNFYKLIKERLKSFFDLRDPVSGTGALCTDSYPHRGQSFNMGEYKGKAIDGRTILFRIKVHTN
jgi:hypothetical protein